MIEISESFEAADLMADAIYYIYLEGAGGSYDAQSIVHEASVRVQDTYLNEDAEVIGAWLKSGQPSISAERLADWIDVDTGRTPSLIAQMRAGVMDHLERIGNDAQEEAASAFAEYVSDRLEAYTEADFVAAMPGAASPDGQTNLEYAHEALGTIRNYSYACAHATAVHAEMMLRDLRRRAPAAEAELEAKGKP
jgi:hypothetical protein